MRSGRGNLGPQSQENVQSVKILRVLWRRRILVVLVAIVALAIGMFTAYRPGPPPERRSYTVGVATASVLLDTPRSQVVEVAPEGSDALASRANVLANLMTDGEIKDTIVRRAGLTPAKVVASSESPDIAAAPPVLTARSIAYSTGVALTSDMAELPIIRVRTQAPDVAQAIKLANAAVQGLTEYLDGKAADEGVSSQRRLRVRALGTAQGHTSTRGPGRMMGVAVSIVVFAMGCGLILALTALIGGWRAAVALERRMEAANEDRTHASGALETDERHRLEKRPAA
jgi:capsular polysaccharide biosynthesis protein